MLRALVLKHLHNHASGASDIFHVRVTPQLFFLLLINNIMFFSDLSQINASPIRISKIISSIKNPK